MPQPVARHFGHKLRNESIESLGIVSVLATVQLAKNAEFKRRLAGTFQITGHCHLAYPHDEPPGKYRIHHRVRDAVPDPSTQAPLSRSVDTVQAEQSLVSCHSAANRTATDNSQKHVQPIHG